MFQLANIHLLELDISDTMKELTPINLENLQIIEELELTFIHLQNGLKADYKNLEFSTTNRMKFLEDEIKTYLNKLKDKSPLQVTDIRRLNIIAHNRETQEAADTHEKTILIIEDLTRKLNINIQKKLRLEEKTELTFYQLEELHSAIESFLDIYDDILSMDTRDYKEESYHKYFKSFIKSIETGDSEKVEDSGAYAGLDILSSFKSIILSFSNEDEDFFSSIPEVNTQQITRNHLRHEAKQFDKEEASTQLATLDSNQENTDPKKVKLSDKSYSDAIHNSNQAEVKNIIELSKAFCFESAIAIQKYVIQNCKAKNHLNDEEKCKKHNHQADLALKNCESIFPMETSYDEELHEKLMHSVSEHAIISSDGILYIGAGEEVTLDNHFTPEVTPSDITNSEGDLMLSGEQRALPNSDEFNLTSGD